MSKSETETRFVPVERKIAHLPATIRRALAGAFRLMRFGATL
jgi:hypothetical protein